jgi:hypothetical protein
MGQAQLFRRSIRRSLSDGFSKENAAWVTRERSVHWERQTQLYERWRRADHDAIIGSSRVVVRTMRWLIVILAIVLLIIMDQSWYHGEHMDSLAHWLSRYFG